MFDLLKKSFTSLLDKVTNSAKFSIEKTDTEKHQNPEKSKELENEIKIGIPTKIVAAFKQTITLNEKELEQILDAFELMLLEADVNIDVAVEIKNDLRKFLQQKEFSRENLEYNIKQSIKEFLIDLLSSNQASLLSMIKETKTQDRPYVILFFGLNGNGKTTTIAKIAQYLSKHGLRSVISASDTFRAGAIEQIKAHANKLNIPVISREYRADPISVAFDSVNYAKANGIDVVLIDTAGRQETNRNLIDELSKFNRVIKPDLRIYVVESTIGNAAVEQILKFHEKISIDALIITKVDLDAKGGIILSTKKLIKKPILFLCDGQGYDKMYEFEAAKFVEDII
ncbi:MAG: signal recognition particle-docking protein FtsY [Candidatus Micrarchaeota archaeon]|nr:signal recognition particle-docking protein FtsY [Candidatus Micrarchaeota archaeon]